MRELTMYQTNNFVSGMIFILSIISIVISWKLFTKAGVAGWKSIIPIYNLYIVLVIGIGKSKTYLIPFVFLTSIIPLVTGSFAIIFPVSIINIIIVAYINYNFYKRFASTGMSIGALFFPLIFGGIIAFGNYEYTPIEVL